MTIESKPAIGIEIDQQVPLTVTLEEERAKRVDIVGGKAASLAELRSIPGIKVPEAFVITTSLSGEILVQNPDIKTGVEGLDEISSRWLRAELIGDNEEARALKEQIKAMGDALKKKMENAIIPDSAQRRIETEYNQLCKRVGEENMAVAVRSSGISEDGKDNSFAGQYESYLHQQGEEEVLDAIRKCLASQFTERAIEYRNGVRFKMLQEELKDSPGDVDSALEKSKGISHSESKLAVVVQRMVNASVAGVGFSIDHNSGARLTYINISYGLGEAVVGGRVTPDSFQVDQRTGEIIGRKLGEKAKKIVYAEKGTKEVDVPEEDRKRFVITDEKARELANKIATIKSSYGREMDTEFALDANGEIYFVQARPETFASNKDPMIAEMRSSIVPEDIAKGAKVIFKGGETGSPGAANGILIIVDTIDEAKQLIEECREKKEKVILMTKRTDPDWVTVMKEVNGIITRVGGTTCHAAIVSRELGVPCIIGVGDKIEFLVQHAGSAITMDASGKIVYEGKLPLEEVGEDIDVRELLKSPTKTVIGINIANIDQARKLHALGELGPGFKISLLRTEFLLEDIGVHVRALIDFDKGEIDPSSSLYERIAEKIVGYSGGEEYFKTKLTEGIVAFAALFPNSSITLRTTDFKTNEYKNLIGGEEYETPEENPMMGNRGVGRYIRPENKEAFKWELEAIKRARDMGYRNIQVMFPMVRDLDDLGDAYTCMEEIGMGRGVDGLKVGMMVEVPANVILLEEFGRLVDFFSIGSNDLTQLTLGVDRDNEKLTNLPRYGSSNPAVVKLIRDAIRRSRQLGIEIGICGQEPSNNLAFAKMLVEEGINSIGVTPDAFPRTYRGVRGMEQDRENQAGRLSPHSFIRP